MKYTIENIKTIALEPLEVEVSNGEINYLVGQNGSGKTNVLIALDVFSNGAKNKKQLAPKILSSVEDYEDLENRVKDSRIKFESSLLKTDEEKMKEYLKTISNILKFPSLETDPIPNKNIYFSLDSENTKIFTNFDGEYTEYGNLILNISKIIKDFFKLNEAYFTNEDGKYRIIIDEEHIKKIENSSQIPKKNEIKFVLELLLKIEKIYYNKPKVVLIENLSTFRTLRDTYNLKDLVNKNSEGHKDTVLLFNFLSKKIFDEAIKLVESISKSDSTSVSQSLINDRKRLAERINNRIKNVYQNLDIYAYPFFTLEGSTLALNVQNKDAGYIFNDNESTNENSAGYKAIFNLILTIFSTTNDADEDPESSYVILADEIDKNIHPLGQINLINFINEKIKDKNVSFVVSTHSPFLLVNNNDKSNCKVIYRNEKGITKLTDFDNEDSQSFVSSYLVAAGKMLLLNNVNEFYTKRLIVLDTINKKIETDFSEKINRKLTEKNIIVISKEDFSNAFKEIKLEIKELCFASNNNSFKNVEINLEKYKRILIGEKDIKEIMEND